MLAVAPLYLQGAIVTFDTGQKTSGSKINKNAVPKTTFETSSVTGAVDITLTNENFKQTARVNEYLITSGFNYSGDQNNLTFTEVSRTGTFDNPDYIVPDVNGFGFSINFEHDYGNASVGFGNNESLTTRVGDTIQSVDVFDFITTTNGVAVYDYFYKEKRNGGLATGYMVADPGLGHSNNTIESLSLENDIIIKSTESGIVTISESVLEIGATALDIQGGTLLLGADDQVTSTTNLLLNGGELGTEGYSNTLGSLTLNERSSIDLGSGSSVLQIADSSSNAWGSGTLTIENWSGNLSGGGSDQIFVGTSGSGLTAGQASQIRFSNPQGLGSGVFFGTQLASGEIVPIDLQPVPETSTVIYSVLLLGIAGGDFLRRNKKKNS